ncbi:MAG: clan AA aspartic protease [Candidatus Syntrophoarchaeum sp.]|nr:clan AA aspartic protease [Methanomicrobia archaeon]MBL7117477.1 clan AA aspartic protease [Candidatus Syntrophoarchaeum sp.]
MNVRRKIGIPPIITIQIGGPEAVKDVDALIDTGSTYCVISLEDAVGMGYEPWRAATVPVGTAGGMISAPLIKIGFVKVLGFKIENVETIVKDLTGVGIDAVVGWSFLRHFKFSFDSEDGIFEMEEI